MAIRISYETFLHLNPRKLELYEKGFGIRRKIEDERDHMLGIYFREALKSTVCNTFPWKRKGELLDQYPKEPFMKHIDFAENSNELSEEEKQREVDRFFAQEKARRVNWRRTHKKAED